MSQTQSILAIETSTAACSAALLCNGVVYERFEILPQKHAHRALEMVDEVLQEAGISGEDVDLLAYGEGPGAFTGVRVASGVVQGLALGWDKPVVGVSSLEAMAEMVVGRLAAEQPMNHREDQRESVISWCALMDARMQEVYLLSGRFNPATATWHLDETQLISPEAAVEVIAGLDKGCIGLGDIHKEYPHIAALFDSWTEVLPSAAAVVQIALRNANQARGLHESVPMPVYLRNHIADTIEERKQKAEQKALLQAAQQ